MARLDYAHRWTDKQLAKLERKIHAEYEKAVSEMKAKQRKFMDSYMHELEQRERALDNTDEAMKAHKAWLEEQAMRSRWFDEMTSTLAEDASNANRRVMEMLGEHIPNVYAENANWAAYGIEKATGIRTFTLVDADTVRNLLAKEDVLVPRIDKAKDIVWNKRKFQSAITQGILQGESVDDIAKRVKSVVDMDERAARRAARTATTSAENAGRMNSYGRAKDAGIDIQKEWLATLDGNTRGSHRELDGKREDPDKPFEVNGHEIRFPGDPEAHPSEVYNCRCTLVAYIPDIEYDDWRKDETINGMSYGEWRRARKR